MNVTFLVGNGFDIGLGLKTRYSDFYEEYCKADKADSEIITKFKQTLREWQNNKNKKIIDWSDFEFAFGQYAKQFAPEDSRLYLECFEHFIESFNSYLEKEVKKVYFVENKSVISDTMLKAIEGSYYNICREDRAIINKIYSQDKGVKVFRFVTFNYTKCIDKCVEILKNSIKDNSSYKIKPTLHIHGYIEENMIVGVNDGTQIDNISFSKDEAVIQEMVKPTQNAESRTGYDRALTQQINESDIICIYGMSIGDTDKKWWTLISKWLSADDKHIVIILSHQEENVIRFPHKQRKSRISIVQKLLSFSKQSEPLKSLIKERIYVGFNNDIFKMDLSIKKEDASEKFDMLPYIADYGKSIGQMFGGIENNSYDLPKVNTIGSGKGIAAISTVKGIDIPSIVDKPSTSSIIDFEQDDDSIKSISKRKPLTIKL